MKSLFIVLILLAFFTDGFSQKPLFNGSDLKGWDIYIGSPIEGFEQLKEKATPENTYSVVELDGEKVIRVSGEVNASLATKKSFKNYHIRLIFKWGDKVYGRRNSGLLYHSFGDFGAAFGTWMTNIEHQLMHSRLGDTYLMNNTYCETKASKIDDKTYQFSKDAYTKKFGEEFHGRSIKKAIDAEKPLGEWNTVDLYCYENASVHVVNGKVVMINMNCSKIEDGEIIPLTKGKIQIQSEGGEMYIKTIEIEKIKGIPTEFIQ